MAKTLTIKEVSLYESKAGVTWTRTQAHFQTTVCRQHQALIRVCDECQTTACEEHLADLQACGKCKGPDLGGMEWAALDWVLRRRDDPKADFDEDGDIGEAMARVGEWFTAAFRGQSSAVSSKNGSPLSSIGSAASEG